MKGNAGVYDVLDFGAKADGATDDAKAVQEALDACREAGGGVQYVDVFYPDQKLMPGDVRPYPYTISATGENCHVVGVSLRNSYDGINLTGASRRPGRGRQCGIRSGCSTRRCSYGCKRPGGSAQSTRRRPCIRREYDNGVIAY